MSGEGVQLQNVIFTDTMHQRKQKMAELSDSFIAMPGGYGTWEELGEMLTWTQLGIQSKAIGVLNVCGFYDHWLAMVDRGIEVSEMRLLLAGCFTPHIAGWLYREQAARDHAGGRRTRKVGGETGELYRPGGFA